MRHILAFAFSVILGGCIPDEKDPGQSSDIGQLNGAAYAAALGAIALQAQNAVVGDPSWFSVSNALALDLAAMGINSEGLAAPARSHVCPTGNGTEVLQVSWLDGRDASNRFWMRGIGGNTGTMLGALRNRVAGDQVGTYDGSMTLQLANGTGLGLPSSCAGLGIPLGAPVLVFRIERPAAPVAELARTEYRTVDCGADIRGIKMRGTMVESRIVRYATTGEITPADPNAGWSTETVGTCVSDAIVTATATTSAGGGSVALNTYADLASNSLKAVLEEQLRMDCGSARISSDLMQKDEAGNDVRRKSSKSIDTCAAAGAAAAQAQVGDTDAANMTDSRDICVEKSTVVGNRSLLGVHGGTLTSTLAGTAWVDRIVDNRSLSSTSAQTGERMRWVGRSTQMSCVSTDSYVAQCGSVPGAPPRSTDFAAAANKWNRQNVKGYTDKSFFDSVFGVCLFSCEKFKGGTVQTLNWKYFSEKRTLHADTATTRAVGSRSATSWIDSIESFIPNFVAGAFTVPSATNQCRVRYKEIQLDCPLAYDAAKQAGWTPFELGWTNVTTLLPGGSYTTKYAGKIYHDSLKKGDAPGLVEVRMEKCSWFDCDSKTYRAGPGLNAYIKSWKYSDRSSVSSAQTSVQTVLLDTEPQLYDLVPGIDPGPLLRYNKREYIRGLHCGRLERRNLGSWPVQVRTASCGMKGCTTSTTSTTTQVTEVVRREWYGDNATAGTWSQPSVRYETAYGNFEGAGSLPNPIVIETSSGSSGGSGIFGIFGF